MDRNHTANAHPVPQEAQQNTNPEQPAANPRPPHHRLPSDDLPALGRQLVGALEELHEEGSEDALGQVRLFLSHAQALTWRGVAGGDPNAPRQTLDHLLDAQSFADVHLPEMTPRQRAAVEIHIAIRGLYRATEALESLRLQARLADREHSATEQEVLRVLYEAGGEFLRRQQVHDRMQPERRPTAPRVGQILVELHHDGLLLRREAMAQGNPRTGFYGLSKMGYELTKTIGLTQPQFAQEISVRSKPADRQIGATFATLASHVHDPRLSKTWRSLASGLLCNMPSQFMSDRMGEYLSNWLCRVPRDELGRRLLGNIMGTWGQRLRNEKLGDASRELLEELSGKMEGVLERSTRKDAEATPRKRRATDRAAARHAEK